MWARMKTPQPTTSTTAKNVPSFCGVDRPRIISGDSRDRLWSYTYAVRAVLALTGRVGADGRADVNGLGVDNDQVVGDGDGEAIQTPRRRPTLFLPDPVVLRSVTRALEPLG